MGNDFQCCRPSKGEDIPYSLLDNPDDTNGNCHFFIKPKQKQSNIWDFDCYDLSTPLTKNVIWPDDPILKSPFRKPFDFQVYQNSPGASQGKLPMPRHGHKQLWLYIRKTSDNNAIGENKYDIENYADPDQKQPIIRSQTVKGQILGSIRESVHINKKKYTYIYIIYENLYQTKKKF